MNTLHRTPNTIKSLTLKLSLSEGVVIGDVQGKKYRITVPLNGLVFDNHNAAPAWLYAIFTAQLGNGTTPAPAGARLTNTRAIMFGDDATDPRQAIVSRLILDIEFSADAESFDALHIVVKGYAAATNAPASFSLPAFTPSEEPPFVVADADGGTIEGGIAVEEVSLSFGDAETLNGQSGSYYRNRANHEGEQEISTITGLETALSGKQSTSEKGSANGYASLDGTGKVPAEQLPSVSGNATQIQGIDVDDTPPTDGDTLVYNAAEDRYEPAPGGGTVNILDVWLFN